MYFYSILIITVKTIQDYIFINKYYVIKKYITCKYTYITIYRYKQIVVIIIHYESNLETDWT